MLQAIGIIQTFVYSVCFGALICRFYKSKGSVCLALIPPFFLDCVVAIGIMSTVTLSDGTKKQEFKGLASGFLYGHFLERVSEKESNYQVFLVTNRHVLKDIGSNEVYVRFNPETAEPAREYPLKEGTQNWFAHPCPDVDVAIVPINVAMLKEQGIKFSFF